MPTYTKGFGVRTLVFVDVESGCYESTIHGLTEVAAAAFTLTGDGSAVEVETFQTLVRPNENMAYVPQALIIQGRTLEQLYAEGKPEPQVYAAFEQFITKHVGPPDVRHGLIWAHNAPFDHGFIYALEGRVRSSEAGFTDKTRHFPKRNDWSCTKAKFYDTRAMGVHEGRWSNLKEVARQFGVVQGGDAHTALVDVRTGYRCLAAMQQAQDTHTMQRLLAAGQARTNEVLNAVGQWQMPVPHGDEDFMIQGTSQGAGARHTGGVIVPRNDAGIMWQK